MSDRVRAETLEDVLKWVEQLHEDIKYGDWATAYEESLPVVAEAVKNRAVSGSKESGRYQVECPDCGDEARFLVYGFDQSGHPRWYVCSSCETHFRPEAFRSLHPDSSQGEPTTEDQ